MVIVKLTDSESDRPIYINTAFIVGFHDDDYDGGTKVICGANGGHVFFVRESPQDVAKLIANEEYSHMIEF